MSKTKLFNKGDIILTNPEEGFWGIAVVLSEREKTPKLYPMCHIAITPIISQKEILFSELNMDELVPLEFERLYTLEYQKRYKPKDFKPFYEKETCIGVYTRRNKADLKVIGNIDPKIVYDGPLPFEPLMSLKVTWPLCGDPDKNLGREAFITWERKNSVNEQPLNL
ncbi:MAG: hypothetical protein LBE36_01430 [Flavobacteriaceae bacterium]|jgi:hypothetical protein|nr:hypothetical protein [Flavobacteriaceae bacterium]